MIILVSYVVSKFSKLDTQDIVKEDIYVIHRLVGIENIDNEDRYYTKGDANENLDVGFILDNDILGIVDFKISYIGYPTLWIRDVF